MKVNALGSRLANDSRQNLLAAYELTAKLAAARKAAQRPAWQRQPELDAETRRRWGLDTPGEETPSTGPAMAGKEPSA